MECRCSIVEYVRRAMTDNRAAQRNTNRIYWLQHYFEMANNEKSIFQLIFSSIHKISYRNFLINLKGLQFSENYLLNEYKYEKMHSNCWSPTSKAEPLKYRMCEWRKAAAMNKTVSVTHSRMQQVFIFPSHYLRLIRCRCANMTQSLNRLPCCVSKCVPQQPQWHHEQTH